MSLMLCCRTPSTRTSFSARSATTPGWRLTTAALQPLSDERSTAFGIGEVDFGSRASVECRSLRGHERSDEAQANWTRCSKRSAPSSVAPASGRRPQSHLSEKECSSGRD